MSMARHRWAAVGFCILLSAAGLLLAQTAVPSVPASRTAVKWVRTREGWQVAAWERQHPAHRPPLHPLLVAAFIGLASATALIAFPHRRAHHPDQGD